MDTPVFFVFLFIHIVSLITGFGAVIAIDFSGVLWMLKKLPLKTVAQIAEVTQRLIWIGWVGLVLSGIGLITLKGFIDNLTWIKLFFVAMLGLNGIFLHFIKKATDRLGDVNDLPPNLVFKTGLASTISQLGWWGALSIGFVHRHIWHYISGPKNPWIYMVAIIVLIALAAVIGNAVTRKTSLPPQV
ncbi:MAG: hypothetical protein V4519_00485 [Patescibacteria group bacterium]